MLKMSHMNSSAVLEATARRIRARAFRRLGELSRELDKAPRGGTGGTTSILPNTGKYAKYAVLKSDRRPRHAAGALPRHGHVAPPDHLLRNLI